ncbi:MAG: hypothetical protein ACI9J3_000026 [Parvicellaceae bacterium]|jgi:hypothetical protein
MNFFSNFFIAIILSVSFAGISQNLPKLYNCPLITEDIKVDGNDTELSWSRATWTPIFVDIEGDSAKKPFLETKVKILWDSTYLYVFASLAEPNIWASLENHDDIVYRDNDIEVFIDPDGDSHNYMEIEVNALNTVLDLLMVKPYRNGGPLIMEWNPAKLKTAVHLYGTLNNSSDTDSSWTVEMAIPMSALCFNKPKSWPAPGDYWRINFSRVHYSLVKAGNGYEKAKGSDGNLLPEYNWVWSPQGQINMHMPEQWGYLLFNSVKMDFTEKLPVDAKIRAVLHKEYQAQKSSLVLIGTYRGTTTKKVMFDKRTYELSTKVTENHFEITAKGKERTWHLTDDSKLWITGN